MSAVFILGPTGVGKSELGVELAKRFNGEIINADSLQVYKGLDIVTNKISTKEQKGIPHHLMGFLETDQEYRVSEFVKDADRLIKDMHTRKKIPIIVGGTNYYIQSLLWSDTLIEPDQGRASPLEENTTEESDNDVQQVSDKDDTILNTSTIDLYQKLQRIDPVMANKWHPLDRRKIKRSLQVFYQTGQRHSDLIAAQHLQDPASRLRYRGLLLWLYANPTALNTRLDARVDRMIEMGLFDELRELRRAVASGRAGTPLRQDKVVDDAYQRGIFQAIGYKEYDAFLSAQENSESSRSLDDLAKLKDQGTESMKGATRRYAKRQVQWIRKKLLPYVLQSQQIKTDSVPNIYAYALDASDLSLFSQNVVDKAGQVTEAFLFGENMPHPTDVFPSASELLTPTDHRDNATKIREWRKITCDICRDHSGMPVVLNGQDEWEQHQRSRRHRKNTSSERKRRRLKAEKIEASIDNKMID